MFDRQRFNLLLEAESLATRSLAETYVGEAIFFWELLIDDLKANQSIETVIEIGSGIGLLSLLIAASGYNVVSFEPESAGFSEMHRIRTLILQSWDGPLPRVKFVDDYFVGTLPQGYESADFAFAINVLEHVPDTDEFLRISSKAIKPGAQLRMIFPNYLFPYEPHFNIPTAISKRLTYRIWRRKIEAASFPDPVGMWNDLSWPNLRRIKRSSRKIGLKCRFSRQVIDSYLTRLETDSHFLARKGAAGRYVFRPIGKFGRFALPAIPKSMLPIIDVTFFSA